MRSSQAIAVALAAIAVGAVIGFVALGGAGERADPVAGGGVSSPADSGRGSAADPGSGAAVIAPAAEGVAEPPRADDGKQAVAGQLELPDGSVVAALNGATGAMRLAAAWGPHPWSPIVTVERSDAGVDWYVHADGSRSTTEMKWRPDLGREDALVRVARPQESAPAIGRRR